MVILFTNLKASIARESAANGELATAYAELMPRVASSSS